MYRTIGKIALGALVSVALVAPAMAKPAGKGQVTFVPGQLAAALSDIQMGAGKEGKLKIKFGGADKDGLGGYEVQVAGNSKATCDSNPDSKGLCGPKDNPQPAVLVMLWKVLANIEIENVSEMRVAGGKFVFLNTGKNKSNAAGNVGATVVYNTPIAVGYSSIHDRASGHEDPTLGCGGLPTVYKTECYNANDAMSAGFMYGFDATMQCTTHAECQESAPTLECDTGTGYCAIETCSMPMGDLECENTTGACNAATGNCCNPLVSEPEVGACPDPSPSGAFLDNVQF